MQVKELSIPGVFLFTPRRFGDDRGFFMETFRANQFSDATGVSTAFVQDNHSFSAQKHTVRGLHYQSPPFAQGKLVRCSRGAIVDVAVDGRENSPTYGQWVSEVLTADNGAQLFVPEGFLHGFSTLVDDTDVNYKCTNYYSAECDGSVAWNDPDLGVDWGRADGFDPAQAVLSAKDSLAPNFAQWKSPFKI